MKEFQLVVFDWDGTLMDSTGHIVFCMREAINELGLTTLTDNQISHIIGLGLPEAIKTLFPHIDSTTAKQLEDTYRSIWLSHPTESPLFDNALALLDKLNQPSQFLAVATGKSRRGLNKVLAETGLANRFVATRCADESHSKPNPQMLQELITFCGVAAEQTLMIGDTEFDLMMAHNAGANCVGVSHGAHSEAQLKACSPLAIVKDLFALENWLECT